MLINPESTRSGTHVQAHGPSGRVRTAKQAIGAMLPSRGWPLARQIVSLIEPAAAEYCPRRRARVISALFAVVDEFLCPNRGTALLQEIPV